MGYAFPFLFRVRLDCPGIAYLGGPLSLRVKVSG